MHAHQGVELGAMI